jgi:hypothetical protein
MSKNKTSQTEESVYAFTENVENEVRRNDALKLVEIFKSVSGYEPKMFGPSIIGFGSYHYKYKSGHEGDAPLAAFSPRKDALVLYIIAKYENRDELLLELGKYRSSKACIYVKKLDDINLEVLGKVIENCVREVREMYPSEA